MSLDWTEGHIHVQMRLPRIARILNPLLQNALRLLHKLPMQINCVAIHPPHRVILPEYIIARLSIILVRHRAVSLTFLGQLVRGAAVTALVGLLRFRHAGGAFAGFGTGEIPQAVILAFGIGVGGVIEGWGGVSEQDGILRWRGLPPPPSWVIG